MNSIAIIRTGIIRENTNVRLGEIKRKVFLSRGPLNPVTKTFDCHE